MDKKEIGLSRVSAIIGALTLLVSPVHAAVITINPSVDGYIRGSSSASSGNFNLGTMQLGSTTTEGINDLLAFDLGGVVIPEGMEITSVTLSVTIASVDAMSQNAGVVFQLFQSLRSFSTGATWNNYTSSSAWDTKGAVGTLDRGSSLLSSFSVNPAAVTVGQAISLNSSIAFVSLVDGLVGMAEPLRLWLGLASQIDGDRHLLQIATVENANTAYRPILSITYDVVPEPSIVALGVFGCGFLLLSLRRKRAMR